MTLAESPTAELILQARVGCQPSLGKLLDSYRHYLLRIAARRLDSDIRCRLAPSDVVQGSLLIAARDFQQFRGGTDNELRAWLLRILSSQLVDGMRRFVLAEKRRTSREQPNSERALAAAEDGRDSPSRIASHQEEADRLIRTMKSLPPELRDVVQARYFDGLKFEEIAARLQTPVTTCRRRWIEAVDRIRQGMGIDP